MRPSSFTVQATAAGNTYSKAYIVDHYSNPCNIAVGVVTSGASYTVQHTFADPFTIDLNSAASAAAWMNNQYVVATAGNMSTNYAFAPTAIRFFCSGGTGEATMTVVQAGPNS